MYFAAPVYEPNSAAQPLITRAVEEKSEEPFDLPWTRPEARVIGPQAQGPLSFSGKESHDKTDEEEWVPETVAEEARLEGTKDSDVMLFPDLSVSENQDEGQKKKRLAVRQGIPGIKRGRGGKSADPDMPPTPWGCEWIKTSNGWNLWRVWWVRDKVTGEKIKMSRYAGALSYPAWHVMKEYDDEKFISIIGQRVRRYSKR
ncbi:MAG: hypothetical protein L0220_05110 [Acidobacteria bacterium]|nr:hypothetical protein [Acidobacteriota bacterium]